MPAPRTPSSLLGLFVAAGLTTACGARSGVGVSATSSGAGGATTTLSSGSGGTGPARPCTVDGDCSAGAFCWLGACVKLSAVTTNGYHSCALTTQGGVQCWGDDGDGELGNDSMEDSPIPVAVSGLASSVAAISAGFKHTCALTATSNVLCWGSNGMGQLGTGPGTGSQVPAAVAASGIEAISAGFYHTCALSTAGGVACWGWNQDGQLGDGTVMDSPVPVMVSGLSSGVAAVAAGGGHSCALTAEGGVKCWGDNFFGELGDGGTTLNGVPVPVAVSGLSSGVAAIAAGDGHTCALTTEGGVLCWGRNHKGQLGTGSGADSYVPVPVLGLSSGVAGIAARGLHTCATMAGGGARCWGWNDTGQLGDGTTTDSPIPVDVSGLSSGVAAIDASYEHTCALTTEGSAKCWGSSAHDQLGNGSMMNSPVPVGVVES